VKGRAFWVGTGGKKGNVFLRGEKGRNNIFSADGRDVIVLSKRSKKFPERKKKGKKGGKAG